MSVRESNRVGGHYLFPVVYIVMVIVSTVAAFRLEAEMKMLIQARHLYELMDAAGITDWQPLTEIHSFMLRLGLLLGLIAVAVGLIAISYAKRVKGLKGVVVMLVVVTVTMVGFNVCNMYAVWSNPCLQKLNYAVFPMPPDAEPRLDQLMCSAWCHQTANASVVSSCGAPSPPLALEVAARMNISEWCGPVIEQQSLNASANIFSAVSPAEWLRSEDLQCGPLDGWLDALIILTSLTGTIGLAFLILGVVSLMQVACKPEDERDVAKQTATLGDALVCPVAIEGALRSNLLP